ncbi:hypothetical protein BKA65DRAFT_483004 [Rhexocercosporidium sp. MPI-PUGE-AT-0058]|nr:hypothetical protein BKA65DRAFT_483004 [Rhexocercosporidium sp. MPI-PUGE-AT-0058]
MSLGRPDIEGPLNELTNPYGIRVTHQRRNARVSIYTIAPGLDLIAQGDVKSSDDRVPMLPGKRLKADMQLYAVQEADGLHSNAPTGGDMYTGVQPSPSSLGPVAFRTHLYECGRFIWLTGAVPGTTVEVFWTRAGMADVLLGRGPCLEGNARFQLSTAIPPVADVKARQRWTRSTPSSGQDPPRGCDASIDITDVYDGALVTLQPDNLGALQAGFELNDMKLILDKPLREGTSFTLKQDVHEKCERFGIPSNPPIVVGPLEPVDPPVIKGPLCAGSTSVFISNLRKGANVEIINNSLSFKATNKPDETEGWFRIEPPLDPGKVFALQEQCGVSSHYSNEVVVEARHEHIDPCTIIPPLFDCARNVSVKDIHAPAILQVCILHSGGRLEEISALKPTSDTETVIQVYPYLRHDTDIVIRQWACSNMSTTSPAVRVQTYPRLQNPEVIGPIFPGDKVVEISKARPGAGVELWVIQNKGNGPRVLTSPRGLEADNLFPLTLVNINTELQVADQLGARQFLCSETSIDMPLFSVQQAEYPRPFYAIAHNPNKIQDGVTALGMGCNALGPDINVFDDGRLSVSHGHGGGDDNDLISYLKDVHTLAGDWPLLSLIVFDCKEDSHTANNGLLLLKAIREYLTKDFPLISIIISIPQVSGAAMFEKIAHILRPREGLMVDQEDSAGGILDYFRREGISNGSYGNGNSVVNLPFANSIRPSIEWACGLKAGEQDCPFQFVYTWTVNDEDRQREWLRIGVDGIMSGIDDALGFEPGLHKLLHVMKEPEFTPLVRLATRADNALKLPNAAYQVIFHTGTRSGAGTDSTITFALKGSSGVYSAPWSVDTSMIGKFENDRYDHVTYPSGDLGDLTSIRVWKTSGGLGPDWDWESATVRSNRWMVVGKIARVNQWVDDTAPVTGNFA